MAAPSAPEFTGPPRTVVRPGGAFGRLLAGELRILLRGAPRWWWAVAAAITVAGLVAPLSAVPRIVLPAAWIWPVLFMGAVRADGHPAGPPAPAVAALSALLLGAVFAAGAARRGKG
ncbi:hypothetical protein ACH4U7_03635 [Streptomyces sp. NPDC020845]|uniref:hypothetical protein n=1 Tax=Streptomyces sp. NPDC020845 TaxID=3365096 RepID=UPI0037BA3A85